MNNTFSHESIPLSLQKRLQAINFTTPTPIQEQTIPVVLAGKDVLGSAQTGTGKTGAFVIPVIAKIIQKECRGALIICPTRELATQVFELVRQLISYTDNINTALLIGGQDIRHQFRDLRKAPKIIVGTPGRINDHLERQSVSFDLIDVLVLDETDCMLDMGFEPQIKAIIQHLPTERQTLMFSATFPKRIIALAQAYLKNPERIAIGSTTSPIERIKQESINVQDHEKYDQLTLQLTQREGSIIVFVKTKRSADKIASKLRSEDYAAEAIHGDLPQGKRNRVIESFRKERYRIMVATDVAARGIDIPHVKHIVNYDLPQCPEDYIHRIGRTGRAGAEGSAICFISPADKFNWSRINRLINPGSKEESTGRDNGGFGGGNSRGGFGGNRRRTPYTGNSENRPYNRSRSSDEGSSSSAFGDRPRSSNGGGYRGGFGGGSSERSGGSRGGFGGGNRRGSSEGRSRSNGGNNSNNRYSN